MPLVEMKQLLDQAQRDTRAVGAFSVGSMEMILGAVYAAEAARTPVILQIAEVRLPYAPLDLIGPMMVAAARQSSVDIAVHFDHGQDIDTIRRALNVGFTSVMFDGSTLPFAENVDRTAAVVRLARQYGATVEGELGMVGGSEGGSEKRPVCYTAPVQAARFANGTGIDALAVAIGNAHGNYTDAPALRFEVLEKIQRQIRVPLVLHGGTGISNEDFRKAITLGIHKINIATASFDSLTQEAEVYLKTPGAHNYFDLNRAMVQGVYENVKRHIAIFNNGKDFRA